jgi:hypothetical protein
LALCLGLEEFEEVRIEPVLVRVGQTSLVVIVFMYLFPVACGSPETHVAGQEQDDANQQNDGGR